MISAHYHHIKTRIFVDNVEDTFSFTIYCWTFDSHGDFNLRRFLSFALNDRDIWRIPAAQWSIFIIIRDEFKVNSKKN